MNGLDEPVVMAGLKLLLTDFGIHHKLESSVVQMSASVLSEDEDDDFVRLADSVVKKAEKMKSLKVEDENILTDSFSKSLRVVSTNGSANKTPVKGSPATGGSAASGKKALSPEKESVLRNFLVQRGTKKVTPVRSSPETSRSGH